MAGGGEMTFKPLLLSPPMVRAYLDGRKIMTRRVVKPPAPWAPGDDIDVEMALGNFKALIQPGEHIWWREMLRKDGDRAIYEADGKDTGLKWRWKNKVLPSIFMPKSACRAVAEVLEVRAERVQEISRQDIRAEGIGLPPSPRPGRLKKDWGQWSELHCEFADLWNSIHGPRAWKRNEYVWVYRFRPLKGDELKQALEVLNDRS